MLTTMKLLGDPQGLVEYHTHQENYYFKQAEGLADILRDKGLNIISEETIDHVQVNGKLCNTMGLKDGQAISEQVFLNLLNGKDAEGTQRSRKHKVKGIDFTFSAPKTVSIAGLVTDKNPEIIKAHDQTVLEVMKEIEERHAMAQPKAGVDIRTGKMCYITVRDGFNREHDPQLHTHVVVTNLTEYENKIMALRSREILSQDFNKLWGSMYRTRLASRLKNLGYNISYTKGGEWRLDKIAHQTELIFSTRRQQILEAKAEGKRDMDAWRTTRKEKSPKSPKDEITKDWQTKAERTNTKTEEQNKEQTKTNRQEWSNKAEWSIEAYHERNDYRNNTSESEKWQLAIRRATEKSASSSQQAVITEYLAERMHDEKWEDITYQEALVKLNNQVEMGYIIELQKDRYTSWEMVKADREYMNASGTSLNWEKVDPLEVSKIVEGKRKAKQAKSERTLSDIQSLAVQKMIVSNTLLTVVQGDAGSGKTTALKTTGDFYKESGIEVIGLAMQGVTAKNLEEETNIKSTTLSSFLSQERKLKRENKTKEQKKRVLIFDEASMLDSRNASKLFKLAEKNKDKIILVGDRNQLESISAGKVFDRLVEDCERAGDLINLTENFRQRDEKLKQSVEFARDGKMLESLELLDQRDKITEITDKLERREKVAKQYTPDTLIITGTGSARDEINLRIRFELTKQDKINNLESRMYKAVRTDQEGIEHRKDIKLAKNDIITFTRNEYKEYDLRNGERGKILEAKEKSLKIELEDGRKITLDTEKYKHIDYGYALTTYKAQGQTYNKVVVEADTNVPSLLDMRNQYVNITRARDDIKIFTDDKQDLKELADIKTHAKDTFCRPDITLDQAKKSEDQLWTNIRNRTDKKIIEEIKTLLPEISKKAIEKRNNRTKER